MTPYIVAGPTVALTATAVSSGGSIAPSDAQSGVGGANGPVFLKVVNTSATVPVFFATGASAPTAVSGTSNCIAPGATNIIQTGVPRQIPETVFFAAVAAAATAVFVTPVSLA